MSKTDGKEIQESLVYQEAFPEISDIICETNTSSVEFRTIESSRLQGEIEIRFTPRPSEITINDSSSQK